MNQQASSAPSIDADDTPNSTRRSYPGHIAIPAVTTAAAAVSLILVLLSNLAGFDSYSDFSDAIFSDVVPIFIIAGFFGAYQSLVERAKQSENPVSRLIMAMRVMAGLIAIAVVSATVYLSATQDHRLLRNSISAYQHSSGRLVFVLAGIGLAFLLITEATTKAQWTIAGRTVQLDKAYDEVRIGSAFLACMLVIYPTAPEGGDLYSNSSVLHGFSSLGLFLGLILLVGIHCIESGNSYLASRSRRDRIVTILHFMCGSLLVATVIMCITVVIWKVFGGALFWLEIVALSLYFSSFTLRNRLRDKKS